MKYFQILLLLGMNIPIILLGQSIELPQKFMNKDEIKNIPIYIYNVTNLQSIQLIIEYDETIVLAEDEEDIIEDPVGILNGDYTFNTTIPEPGIINIAIGSNSANLFSGSVANFFFNQRQNIFRSLVKICAKTQRQTVKYRKRLTNTKVKI